MKFLFHKLRLLGANRAAAPAAADAPVPYLLDKFPQYQIGAGSYGSLRVKQWGDSSTLVIGAYCSFASGVQVLLGGEHHTKWLSTYPFSELWPEAKGLPNASRSKGDVVVGSDVWVGTDAMIMSGVCIGSGSIIGAGAVVTRDVPPYGIVAGNPARLIRKRFSDATIEALLEVAWWNWERSRIVRALPMLQSERIEDFLSAAADGSL